MNYLARTLVVMTLLGTTVLSAGCFGLAATGLVVGSLAITDRRTLGAQTEDAMIEFKAERRLSDQMRYPGGISVTSYNRRVLLTGQVANEADKRRAETLVGEVDNVRQVQNELNVSGQPSLTANAADATVTAAVKAALVEAKDVPAASIRVVTVSGVVYLLGLVTQRESQAAIGVASRARGVQKVVAVFEVITDEEQKRLSGRPS